MKHRLLRVVQRLFQYQVLLTGGPHRRSRYTEVMQGKKAPKKGCCDIGKLCDDPLPSHCGGNG